jgi:uncharacterized protein YfaQ (DUF2300 family)
MKPHRFPFLILLTLGLLALVVASACVGDNTVVPPDGGTDASTIGSLGQPCFSNGTCNAGLTCISNVCVQLDAGGTDAPIDSPNDQQTDASDAATTVYSSLSDTSKWSSFDMTTVNAGAGGFYGTAFDGRYVYFVPLIDNGSFSGIVGRYDTTATFTTQSSWSVFDTSTVNAGANGFSGAAFDGRFLYLVPGKNSSSIMARYDTTMTFTTAASWSMFDTSTVKAGVNGFVGATFDGRYLYVVPFYNNVNYDGLLARYDTTMAFTTASSWSTFDTTTVNAGASGFVGAVFDGRYVYLVPNSNSNGPHGLVVRYDTMAAFLTLGAWSSFDLTGVNAGATGFVGGSFDGRYVYFAPNDNGSFDGITARYDTMAAGFTMASSWSAFDLSSVNAGAIGFRGAGFDGRYIYFVPSYNTTFDGLVTRFDTTATFTATGSWSTFDMTTVNGAAQGFTGAAFDGRYMYFVPNKNSVAYDGVVMRFDAKTPPSLPAGYAHGSFL